MKARRSSKVRIAIKLSVTVSLVLNSGGRWGKSGCLFRISRMFAEKRISADSDAADLRERITMLI